MRERVVLAVALAALCATGFLLSSQPAGQKSTRSDDLWAQAILSSLPLVSKESETGVALDLYRKAIETATKKAPVLVSLGDFYRSPSFTHDQFGGMFNAIARSAHFESSNASARRIENLLRQTEEPDEAVRCYAAAVAADPNYRPAWFRLACFADDDVALDAARWFQERAPENALGWYLEAVHHIDVGDISLALEFTERGNRCQSLFIYPPDRPKESRIVYPPEYKEVAGHPVPGSALDFLLEKQNEFFSFMDPLRSGCKRIAYSLGDAALGSAERGNVELAVRQFIAVHSLCELLVSVEPPHDHMVVSALVLAQEPMEGLRKLLPENSPERRARERVHARMRECGDLIREQYLPLVSRKNSPQLADILLGRVRLIETQRETLEHIRKESRF